MDPDAVCGKDAGRRLGKEVGMDTAVIGDGHRRHIRLRTKVIGKTLACPGDGDHIHAIRPGPQNATQTAGAELELAVKAIFNGCSIAINACQFFM